MDQPTGLVTITASFLSSELQGQSWRRDWLHVLMLAPDFSSIEILHQDSPPPSSALALDPTAETIRDNTHTSRMTPYRVDVIVRSF